MEGEGILVAAAGLFLSVATESKAAPLPLGLPPWPWPPPCPHPHSEPAILCISGWVPAEAARRRVCSRNLCSSLEMFHWAGLRGAASGRVWVGVEGLTPSMRLSLAKSQGPFPAPGSSDHSRLETFGKGLKPVFFKRTGFLPALGCGNSPGNGSLKYSRLSDNCHVLDFYCTLFSKNPQDLPSSSGPTVAEKRRLDTCTLQLGAASRLPRSSPVTGTQRGQRPSEPMHFRMFVPFGIV